MEKKKKQRPNMYRFGDNSDTCEQMKIECGKKLEQRDRGGKASATHLTGNNK